MCPTTAAGRIITCLCALCGPATMGMLISVLVDRYQRVYNRKMYIQEDDVSNVDLDIMASSDDEVKSSTSSRRTLRRQDFSTAISQHLTSFHGKIKHEPHSSNKLQFVVSMNNKKTEKDSSATDCILAVIKKKMAEVVALAEVDVDLKLVDGNSKELWSVSSSSSTNGGVSALPSSASVDDVKQSKIHAF